MGRLNRLILAALGQDLEPAAGAVGGLAGGRVVLEGKVAQGICRLRIFDRPRVSDCANQEGACMELSRWTSAQVARCLSADRIFADDSRPLAGSTGFSQGRQVAIAGGPSSQGGWDGRLRNLPWLGDAMKRAAEGARGFVGVEG